MHRLVNDALVAAGKKPLGFINPWLYSKAYKTFTDVTIGSSFGCNTTGFPATEGWDAVTGFGTPVSLVPHWWSVFELITDYVISEFQRLGPGCDAQVERRTAGYSA